MTTLSPARVRQILDRARKTRILVIGDLILDHFVWGRVRRISPEEPVPVVEHRSRPTSVKSRIVAHQQQVVRLDREVRDDLDPSMTRRLLTSVDRELPACSAVTPYAVVANSEPFTDSP